MDVPARFHSSDGVSLAGNFHTGGAASRPMPGIVLAHGFAAVQYPKLVAHLVGLGYGVLDFHFRGYGLSSGDRGHVIPHEQVLDLRGAITWLTQRPEIDPARIGVVGSSLGGSVAIMEAADDDRVRVCVVGCPLAKGDTTFRKQHDTNKKFADFLRTVKEKKRNNERIFRWDIVFIPEHLRRNLPPDIPMEFTAETVDGFLAIDAVEAVSRIAPRPLLIIHATNDHVVPFEEAQLLATRAGTNCELELVRALDHHIFLAEPVVNKIGDWLVRHLPGNPRVAEHSTGASGV